MAIDASLIGRLGGSSVEASPIDGQVTGITQTSVWSADVPDGETWMIAIHGEITNGSTLNAALYRWLGIEQTAPPGGPHEVTVGGVITGPETVHFEIRSSSSTRDATFTGTAYTAPLPDD